MKSTSEIQQMVEDTFGEVIKIENLAPGMYEAVVRPGEDRIGFAGDYYIVETDSSIISSAAKAHGKLIEGYTGVISFDVDDTPSGKFIIDYELAKYRIRQGIPLLEGESLRSIALYGMEHHPDYFGEYPVPSLTPWGYTVRHKRIDNGVYWIETDKCKNVLSVCYPYWNTELSEYAIKTGARQNIALIPDGDDSGEDLFFLDIDACVPIFELLEMRPEWSKDNIVNPLALMNAIWDYHPKYAIAYNTQEQAGFHNTLGLLVNSFGGEAELHGSPRNMILMTPDMGNQYLNL